LGTPAQIGKSLDAAARRREHDRRMKTLTLIVALALASLFPTTASARPIFDPVVSTPAPVFMTHHESR